MYGTALYLGFLRNKLREHGLIETTELHTVRPGDTRTLGCFDVEWVHATHSIPDACALVVRTPAGVIVHSGDFKIDTTPVQGEPPDLARLARIGDEGVLLLLSDSTNAEQEGTTPSERTVGEGLAPIFAAAQGRILMATFASNISRLQQAINAAQACGRRCFIVGRSMLKNIKVAEELGYLHVPPGMFVTPKEHSASPTTSWPSSARVRRESRFRRWCASPRASIAWSACARTTRWSSAQTPSPATRNRCTGPSTTCTGAARVSSTRRGTVCTHPGTRVREELKLLLTLTRPKYFIPVHGEYRHLALHAALARSVGIPAERVLAIDNGTVIALDEHGVRPTGERVRTGYVYVDGLSIEEAGDVVFRDRQQLAQDGVILVVLTVERSSGAVVAGPDLVSRGFVADDADALFDEAREHVLSLVSRLRPTPATTRGRGRSTRGSRDSSTRKPSGGR